jgi:hypothetical protein
LGILATFSYLRLQRQNSAVGEDVEKLKQRLSLMGTVGVPDRYRLPKEGEIVEVQYLYCHTGADENREATMHLPA